jgi:hypothetical protein
MGLPQARLGKIHNLITFIRSGFPKLHFLDGRWVDDGGNEIPESEVPAECKDQATALPFTPAVDFEGDVYRQCEFCTYEGPGREYADHLAKTHIRPAAQSAPVAPVRLRPEQLPRGNYEIDAEGFVVLDEQGVPRKKRGRPANRE